MEKFPVIIPARAGSKGIQRKNIIEFCGKPLIAWSIEQGLRSSSVSNVYVSTDGEEIADIAEKFGAKVLRRPLELAADTASSEDAIMHAIKEIEKAEMFSSVVFLQATSPLREINDIDKAVEVYLEGKYDSLFSMSIMEDCCLWKSTDGRLQSFSYDYKNRKRRQEHEPIYLENGSIYVFSKETFFREKNRLGGKIGMYEMPFEHSYEIDSAEDVNLCEFFMKMLIRSSSRCPVKPETVTGH